LLDHAERLWPSWSEPKKNLNLHYSGNDEAQVDSR
jgi:hypothetical protein